MATCKLQCMWADYRAHGLLTKCTVPRPADVLHGEPSGLAHVLYIYTLPFSSRHDGGGGGPCQPSSHSLPRSHV